MTTEQTEPRDDRMVRRYLDGESLRAIAAAEGVVVETVRRALRGRRVILRGRGPSPATRKAVNEAKIEAARKEREAQERELFYARRDGELRIAILRSRADGKEPNEIAEEHGLALSTVQTIQGEATVDEIRKALRDE